MTDSLIVSKISDLVIAMMHDNEVQQFNPAGLLPLADERVLLGAHYLAQRSSPSRVVFVPVNSSWGPPATKSNWVTGLVNSQNLNVGFLERILARPLATDSAEYLVYCWGQSATENDREKDFDATRWLAHVVIRACQRLAMTSVRLFKGLGWIDQKPDVASLLASGHEFCFGVSFDIPVIDAGDQFPPTTLTGVPTVKVQ